LLVYGKDDAAVARLEAVIAAHAKEHGLDAPHRVPLAEVKKPVKEPFGVADGISQPVIRGTWQSYRSNDPIHVVEPGEFVIGYPDNRGNRPPEPELSPLADPDNILPVADHSRAFANSIVDAPRAVARNGSFLVIRQLEQDVKGFWDYCWSESRRISPRLPPPYDVRPDFIAAKLVGRWRDGTSLVRNPYYPMPKQKPTEAGAVRPATNPADGAAISPASAPNPRGDNDFLFGVEDPEALRCPFGAHIRRANPRDSLMPGSMEQVAISNRHRIYRLGRLYAPAKKRNPGLLFMCLNADIERQFEFIQQTWLVSPAFHGLVGEQDPLTSSGSTDATGYVMPSHDGPVRLLPLPKFVTTLGGGYFFMPGRSLLQWMGKKEEGKGARR
jgi:deferrochelatase/peroxidase EfeB